jgi:hypothetical protein
MDSETFDQLPKHEQLGIALNLAASVFGKERVKRHYQHIAPLVEDRVGHGEVAAPAQNYWGGVWQVYNAD